MHAKLTAAFAKGRKNEVFLTNALRYLSKWRQMRLDAVLMQRTGGKVASGPFCGMAFVERGTHGSLAPKLLGTYEHELWPVIDAIISGGYQAVIDIGPAEGYYAVGLAMRMPQAQIYAFDSDVHARAVCSDVAKLNGVATRVTIGEMFLPSDFAKYSDRKTAVICDIEGNEEELLDLERAPALALIDVLVECHDAMRPGLSQRIAERFAATHDIEQIARSHTPPTMPATVVFEDDLDALLAIWEWRMGPTPWLWMRARR